MEIVKENTAMMELRSILIEWSERYRKSNMNDEFVIATKILTKIELELLEKEKEQIMDAYDELPLENFNRAEEYYKTTYL